MTEFQKYVQSIPLTDEELARLVDVSRPAVTRWRAGETEPHNCIKKRVNLLTVHLLELDERYSMQEVMGRLMDKHDEYLKGLVKK